MTEDIETIGEWMGEKLLPCPFCGCVAKAVQYANWGGSVLCSNGRCPVSPRSVHPASMQAAVDGWNMRGKKDFLKYQETHTVNYNWDYPFATEGDN